MKDPLVQVKSLAQSILCTASCVANHQDMIMKQVNSFHQEDNEIEGVEIGEESLLRTDYGIYRV